MKIKVEWLAQLLRLSAKTVVYRYFHLGNSFSPPKLKTTKLFAPGNYVANLYFSGAGISVSAGVGQVDNLTRFCVDFCLIFIGELFDN